MYKGILVAACLFLGATGATAAHVEWQNDLDSALTEAARSKKPVFLHFYADWCVPCHRLERVVFRDDDWIDSIRRSFVSLRVNLDAHPELARKYGVTSIPTDVYLTATGEVLANERSPSSVEGYRQTIAQLSEREPAKELPPQVPQTDPPTDGAGEGGSFFAQALGHGDSATTATRASFD